MIERMAKGMFDATMERRYGDLPQNIPAWPPMREIEQEWLGHARAALAVMVKTTPAMNDAAVAELTDATVECPKAAAWDAVRAYRAMILVELDG